MAALRTAAGRCGHVRHLVIAFESVQSVVTVPHDAGQADHDDLIRAQSPSMVLLYYAQSRELFERPVRFRLDAVRSCNLCNIYRKPPRQHDGDQVPLQGGARRLMAFPCGACLRFLT